MSRKNYFFILLIVCLLLPLILFPVFGSNNQNREIDLDIQSFEKSYFYFKDEGIFFKDQRTAFRGVIWMLSPFSKKPLVLTSDEQTNLCMVEDYIRKLLVENPEEKEKIMKKSIKGLFSLTDKYSNFISAKDFQIMINNRISNYEGDGAGIVFQDNKALVLYVFFNTPAYEVGIKSGDEILKINGVCFDNLANNTDLDSRMDNVESNFKQDELRAYLYEIKRNNKILNLKTKTIKIEKEKIVFYYQEGDIGVIEIKNFNYGCGTQFITALDNLAVLGMKGLIINLRNNPGGLLDEAAIILKIIAGSGFKIEWANGREESCESIKVEKHTFAGPVVVLVNSWTASTAEMVAFCLQEDGNVVIGEKTDYRKNYAQTFKILPNGDYIGFSVCWLKTLNGNSWPDGVSPDIRVSAIKIDQSMDKAKEVLGEKMKEMRTSDSYILYNALFDFRAYFAEKRLIEFFEYKRRELNLF